MANDDIKIRIAAETAEAKKKIKDLWDVFKGTNEHVKMAGAGTSTFTQGLKSMTPVALGAAAGIAVITTAATAAALGLFNLSKGVATTGDELAKTAQKQGIAIETLSELKFAADLANVSFSSLTLGVKNLNVGISDAIAGKTGEAPDAIRDIGVELKNLDGTTRDTSEVLLDIADVFATMEDGAQKTALAAQIFGKRSGPDLIPLLNEGRRGFKAYQDEARRLGVIFDKDLGDSSERFMDSQTRVQYALDGVRMTIARELLPVFADILEDTAEWIGANRELLSQDIKGFLEGMINFGRGALEVLRPIASVIWDIGSGLARGVALIASLPKDHLEFVSEGALRSSEEMGEVGKNLNEAVKQANETGGVINALADNLFGATEKQKKALEASFASVKQQDGEIRKSIQDRKDAQEDAAETQEILNNSVQLYAESLGAVPGAIQAAFDPLTEEERKLRENLDAREKYLKTLGLEGEARIQAEAQMLREQGIREEEIQKYVEVERRIEARNQAIKAGTGASKEAEKTEKELLKTRQDTAKSLDEEIASLEAQIVLFGASAEQIIEYEAETLKAKTATEALTDAFDPQIDKIADLKKELEELNLKEKLGGDLAALITSQLSEAEQAYLQFSQNVNTIYLNMLHNGLSPERAQQLIAEQKAILDKGIAEINKATVEAERASYIERLKASDSFFDNLKGGYLEFADSVESNGELISQFFANTLTEMSQNFSDFFYNAVTGKFENLVDVAKSAFEAILRSFIDMVSAIATRQIVISIAGAFGVDTKGAKATDVLGLGKDALGMAGGAFGLGGGAAALGGTAGAVAGGGMPLIGMGASPLVAGQIATNAGGGIMATIGAAAPYVGAVLAAAALAYTFLGPLLEKTPRLDIDFDSIKTDIGRRAAVVEEFLDDDFFMDNIGQVSVKRKAGLGLGGDEKILELIQDRIEETIEGIQDIISRLPSDMYEILNETLLNADIDIETVIGEERLLEFDAKGKKIAEKFQAFIEGELPAKFFASIRESFFDPAFQALGVSGDATQGMIDDFLADMEAAGSREARAEVGQEFIEKFSAFVDAFNIVEGSFGDVIGQALNSVEALSKELGFNAVPSLDEMTVSLREMIKNAEIDPEVLANFVELRNQLLQVKSALADSISGLVDFIDQLNTKIVGLGGAAVDVGYALDEAIASIMQTLQQEDLSLEEREALLRQLDGLVDQWVDGQTAAQQAVWQEQQAAAQAAAKEIAEAQREAVQGQISALEREKEMIAEVGRERLDALNEELQATQNLFSIAESIGKNIQDLLLGPGGVESPFQRLQRAQADLDSLQARFAGSTGEERGALATEIQELLNTVLSIGGETFDNTSPEFRDTFRQVINELGSLKDQVEPTKSIEQINQEIADLTKVNEANLRSIDDRLETLRAQAQSLGQEATAASQQAFQLDEATAAEAREYYEYIQQEAQAALDARLAQLAELGIETNGALSAGEAIAAEQLVTLRDIHAALLSSIEGDGQTNIANMVNPSTGAVETATGPINFNPFSPFSVIPAATGFEGIVNKAQMFLAGEAGPEHVSITPIADMAKGVPTYISDMVDRLGGHISQLADRAMAPAPIMNLSLNLQGATFGSPETVREFEKTLNRFEERLKREVMKDMVQDMKTKRYLKGRLG